MQFHHYAGTTPYFTYGFVIGFLLWGGDAPILGLRAFDIGQLVHLRLYISDARPRVEIRVSQTMT